jgi:hypothetical protein
MNWKYSQYTAVLPEIFKYSVILDTLAFSDNLYENGSHYEI